MTLTRESESAISSLARPLPPRCSTTSTEYATDDHTRRVPSAPSKADATCSSCSVPSRNRSSGSHRVTGRCRKLPVRTSVTPRSNTSDAWQRIETLRNKAGRDSSHTQKCVILFFYHAVFTMRSWVADDKDTVSRERCPRLLSSMLGVPLMTRDEGRPSIG